MSTPARPPDGAPTAPPVEQAIEKLVPDISTLLAWGAKHPLAPVIGIVAAGAVLVQFVRNGSTGENLLWSLVAVAGVMAFVWALWVLQNYQTAPGPAKVVAWSLCLSGALIFLVGAVSVAAQVVYVPLPLFMKHDWHARDLLSCHNGFNWYSDQTYGAQFEKRKHNFFPAHVFARETAPGDYSFCAIWAPSSGGFQSYSWQTPDQFVVHQLEANKNGLRLVSFNSLTLSDGEIRIQATWLK